ncbi:MAG TPA: hypothetical protein VFP65_26350 [Anaeromyxobacteraceae bacterium]|jgi:hypothetical protein|nr:hypothetical protein [Anaeromyxobacteraceae bacterium]
MERIRSAYRALQALAISLWLTPALALAQQGTQPGSAPSGADTAAKGGGSSFLWIIALLVVLALAWWAIGSRRRAGRLHR